jgi:hypothetical protein
VCRAIGNELSTTDLPAVLVASIRERLELLGKRAFQAQKQKIGAAKVRRRRSRNRRRHTLDSTHNKQQQQQRCRRQQRRT